MSIEFDSQPVVSLSAASPEQQPQPRFGSRLTHPVFWALATNQINKIYEVFEQTGDDQAMLTKPTISPFVPVVSVTRDQDGGGSILITFKSMVRPSRREKELQVHFARGNHELDGNHTANEISQINCHGREFSVGFGRPISHQELHIDNQGKFTGKLSPTSVLIGLKRAVMSRKMLTPPAARQVEL